MPRLRRSDSSGPGIRRVRAGRGFWYRDEHGGRVDDPELLDRIAALAIPPAWTDVWIAPYANGHIQATGVDAAGRRQYLYHPTWREQKDRIKFDRALTLAESLPVARRGVTIDLRREGLGRERVLAAAFRMLDTGSLRVGSERYADEHGSYGLSTLRGAHAVVSEDCVRLHFPAKSGLEWRSEIRDADLATAVRALKRRGGRARLLAWHEGERWHPVTAAEINDDVRDRTGGDFTAKDFRTLHGTIAAAARLAVIGPRSSGRGRQAAIAEAMRAAADVLGNTPAVARSSYVDPRVIDHYVAGRTISPDRLHAAESELRDLLFQ
jgi:DNA topoisomerase-1